MVNINIEYIPGLNKDVGGLKTVDPGAVGQNLGIYNVLLELGK